MTLLMIMGQKSLKIPVIGNFISVGFEYLIRIFFASDISCKAKVSSDVCFMHGHDIVVGAGAVVTKDLPDNCCAVGIPAKIIKQN